MNGKFELFFGCLGNGITVCNKAAMEHGDYKKIAHISTGGNIKLYEPEGKIPPVAMEKIERMASKNKAAFTENFEKLPDVVQYEEILIGVSDQKLIEYIRDKRPLAEKLPEMREYFYKIS